MLNECAIQRVTFVFGFVTTTRERHMEVRFLYEAAPVLRAVKPAALIPLRASRVEVWSTLRNALCQATGLHAREFQTRKDPTLLFVYDETLLASCLREPMAAELLSAYGYPEECRTAQMFRCLQERFGEGGIPHEIGVFLGYPTEDVRGIHRKQG